MNSTCSISQPVFGVDWDCPNGNIDGYCEDIIPEAWEAAWSINALSKGAQASNGHHYIMLTWGSSPSIVYKLSVVRLTNLFLKDGVGQHADSSTRTHAIQYSLDGSSWTEVASESFGGTSRASIEGTANFDPPRTGAIWVKFSGGGSGNNHYIGYDKIQIAPDAVTWSFLTNAGVDWDCPNGNCADTQQSYFAASEVNAIDQGAQASNGYHYVMLTWGSNPSIVYKLSVVRLTSLFLKDGVGQHADSGTRTHSIHYSVDGSSWTEVASKSFGGTSRASIEGTANFDPPWIGVVWVKFSGTGNGNHHYIGYDKIQIEPSAVTWIFLPR
jgi:hypothetical protein